MAKFPTEQWLLALMEKLNNDERYAQIARQWEGDMVFIIQPDHKLAEEIRWYFDLWHGKCRAAYLLGKDQEVKPTFTLRAPYEQYVRLLKGEVEPMQALLTRKIGVQGNMAILMRNVPTVLDFVRCCREITDSYI